MRAAAFRNGIPALFSPFSFRSFVIPSPHAFPITRSTSPLFLRPRRVPFPFRLSSSARPPPPTTMATSIPSSSIGNDTTDTAAAAATTTATTSLEKQFGEFRVQLEESGSVRERIRAVAMEMDSAIRLMQSSILLVHQSLPVPEVLAKAGVQIGVLKNLFGRLAGILRECPGQYYRYHGDWKSETQTAVTLLAFLHWLDTGNLLMHTEAEEKLGLNASEFGLDIEDYLIGICFMSNELPRYVVNQVTAGDYDCPRKVLKFLTDLHASFRMLNLRNDLLRKKFDGMKYDLRRVEEVFYDVKIRGLASGDSTQDQATQG